MNRQRALLATVTVGLLAAASVDARTGWGDPLQPWREKEPDQDVLFHGQLRLRSALYQNLDLDRAPSADGSRLWLPGAGPADLTTGGDMRVRLAPSFFMGESARVFLEIDLLDNVALGARPRFTPFGDTPAIVAATAFQSPLTALDAAFRVRTAMAEVALPFGVLSAGRMPSHFGLGIAANDGGSQGNDHIDDDLGDRADRIGFVLPILGHIAAVSYDVGATGPSGQTLPALGPQPRSPLVSEQAISLALLNFHAPWEVRMRTDDDRVVFDYGLAASYEWQDKDVPSFYADLDQQLGLDDSVIVDRGYQAGLLDGWARLQTHRLRVETELVGSMFRIENPSPYAGVVIRQPVEGSPFGGVAVVEVAPLEDVDAAKIAVEGGFASSDPAPGLPLFSPVALSGAQPGDVYGSQLDGSKDTRMDAFRLHPLHRVDLILWRTLLGGVSEAAYGRLFGHVKPWQDVIPGLRFEGNLIYSQALDANSAPGGAAPLGFEVDGAIEIPYEQFSLRVDGGLLVPLGGLGNRGGDAPAIASMVLVRCGYAF